ncbi:hypothetical protein [Bradyrhizobium sp. SRS-191]|uniref:hypothetical protein n=1 Tax=Bradyrhizobium sp. SRS-191 TaxID=2962606 RepID=UPI00211EBC3A|nr:hypothetical protein [Bradyrhizobium sp. SRS-191]
MTSQQHADDLLINWQKHRDLPPAQRLDAALDAQLAAVATAMAEPSRPSQSSCPGLTRASIPSDEQIVAQMMDGRVKPGHDERNVDGFTAAKIETMAQDLLRYGACDDERAAIRTLSGRGHGQGEIIRLVDRAMARACALRAASERAAS